MIQNQKTVSEFRLYIGFLIFQGDHTEQLHFKHHNEKVFKQPNRCLRILLIRKGNRTFIDNSNAALPLVNKWIYQYTLSTFDSGCKKMRYAWLPNKSLRTQTRFKTSSKKQKQTFFTMRNNNKNMKLPTRSLQSRVKSMLMSMPANVAIVSCAPCQGVWTGKSGTLMFATIEYALCLPPAPLPPLTSTPTQQIRELALEIIGSACGESARFAC